MPKFLVVHPLPAPLTVAEATPAGKAAKANNTVDAYWIGAWGQCNEEGKIVKILCQWNATTAEEVSKVLAKVPIPLEGIYPMIVVDAEDYR